MITRTLVLLKPDAVQRCVMGEIITRFERAGLKIVGAKMLWSGEELAKKHYGEDTIERRGEKVRDLLVGLLREGPIMALCIEGVSAVEVVRKMIGATEPRTAMPGTIRGDYSHHSYAWCDKASKVVRNLIHASANDEEAEHEIALWFKGDELHSYKTVHDAHVF